MSDRPVASTLLAASAVVLLSGVAAYVGATLALESRQVAVTAAPSPGTDQAAIDSLERRLSYVEQRVGQVEEASRTAPELARRGDDGGGQAARAVASAAHPRPGDGPPQVASRDADATPRSDEGTAAETDTPKREADERAKALAEITRVNSRAKLVHDMALFADATQEGPANRRAQALSDARALMVSLGMRGDEAENAVRKVLLDRWDEGARDIGPIVRDGLERTDIATVRDRLRTLDAETDRRMRALLDAEQWKTYEAAAAAARKTVEGHLDDYEKARR